MLAEEVSSGPTITTSSTMTAFSAPIGTYSGEQNYTVTGSNLTAGITVTAPTDFEVSTTGGGSGFGSSVSLGTTGGTVYVRFKRSTAGTSGGNITHASTGATQVDLAVSGTAAVYYTLTTAASPTASGSVTLNPTGGSYASGTVVTLAPVPNSGYAFDSWSGTNAGDIVDTGGVYTIVMSANKSVTANFVVSLCTDVSLTVAEDTHMRSGTTRAAYNYGGTTTIRVNPFYEQGSTDGQLTGALLKWDFSSAGIPADATISAASLTFNVTTGSNYAYSLYNMRQAWVEGTNDAVAGTGASWNFYGAGTGGWGTTGAQNTTSDRYSTNLWGATAADFNTTGSVSFDLNSDGLAVIQGWIAGSLDNNGLTIQNYSGTTTDVWEAASSENATVANRPKLNLTYCVAPTGPTITTVGTLTNFSTPVGTPSAYQTYTVAGSDLTADISISAPAGFEISKDNGATYSSSLTLTKSGTSVATTTIRVRLTGANAGTFSGNITHTSSGATTVNVATGGTVAIYYTLTTSATPTAGGNVTLNPTGGSYASGTVVTLTAVPSSGYIFTGWSGGLSGSTNPTTITMDGNKSVTATFVAGTCTTVNLEASEDTYISGANTGYNYGGVNLFKVTNNSSGTNRGGLIKWDVGSIPSGATVSAASHDRIRQHCLIADLQSVQHETKLGGRYSDHGRAQAPQAPPG